MISNHNKKLSTVAALPGRALFAATRHTGGQLTWRCASRSYNVNP